MKATTIFALSFFVALAVNACASQKWTVDVPATPAYGQSAPIPITVGLDINETPSVQSYGPSHKNRPYGPMIAGELRKMDVFSRVIYPYEKGAAADAVLHLAITGRWGYYGGKQYADDYWAGSSGVRYAEGDHDVRIALTAKDRRIIGSSVSVKSKGRYSGQDFEAITGRLNEIQTKKIAVSVADLLQDKRSLIIAEVFNRPEGASAGNAGAQASGQPKASPVTGAGKEAAGGSGTAEKLKELEDLHASGALSDEEFGKARKRLLDMQKLDDLYRSGVLTEQEVKKAKARLLGK